ncbi:MAG: hypothetical protein V1904_00680 [Bacteroidota bacterium]
MKNKKFAMGFILPFAGAIPVILVNVFEEQIVGWAGRDVWIVFLVISLVLVFGLSLFPFIGVFKGMFGGKGYSFFWGSGKLAASVLAKGKPATATLLKIGENSGGGITTINDQPLLYLTLLIEEGSNPPYQVSFDTIVPRTTLPQLQPGVKFPVKVDASDKNLVVFDESGVASEKMPSVGGKNWTEEDRTLLEKSGIEAMALLMDMKDTGRSEDFKIIVAIIYEVYIPGEEPYKIEKEIPVPSETVQLMRSALGKTFKARVHPNDRQKISVDIRF